MTSEPAELVQYAAPPGGDAGGAGVSRKGASQRRGARTRRRIGWVATMAAGLTMAAVGLIATPLDQGLDTVAAGAQALSPTVDTEGAPFAGTPAVGALFSTTSGGGIGQHFCSASVVDSPARDLLITAAHCTGGGGPIVFIPGYDNGRIPYGTWQVTRVIVSQSWLSSADPDDDVAFLVVTGPAGAKIQDVTGGERLGIGQPVGQIVSVVGYPETVNAPIRCNNFAREFSPTQLVFDCGGYTDGTSGGPLLENVNPSTGLGTVIGVIGGYEQGGDTPSVSYSVRFGAFVAELYKTAAGQS